MTTARRFFEPAFSRPRYPSGFGKNLVPAKTLVPGDIREECTAKVKSEGFETLAQWQREVLIAKARGVDALRKIYAQRLASVAEIVPEKDR